MDSGNGEQQGDAAENIYIYISALVPSHLEAQLLEEPLGLSSLVLGLHGLFQLGADLLLLGGILEVLAGDGDGGLQLKAVAGGHEVGVVDELDKRLDAAATGNLLLIHGPGDL